MRYIDADAFEAFGYNHLESTSEDYDIGFDDGVQYVLECIDNIPTADVRPNFKGEWIEAEICDGIKCNACSVCGYSPFYKSEPVLVAKTYNFNFCPNCGADMRGEV